LNYKVMQSCYWWRATDYLNR